MGRVTRMRLEINSTGPEMTREVGRHLGELAREGDVILLVGDLGSGKTCLTQGIAWGLGIADYALSPTFVIMRELHGRLPLYHVDLYRIDRLAETEDLGLDDYLYGHGVTVVEWAEKALSLMPRECLLVKLEWVSEGERHLVFEPTGERYETLVKMLRDSVSDQTGSPGHSAS